MCSRMHLALLAASVCAAAVAATACDRYCAGLNGPLSYCKTFQKPAVCSMRNQPCDLSVCGVTAATNSTSTTTTAAPVLSGGSTCTRLQQDSFCQRLNGPLSYCKLSGLLCHGGNQPCACSSFLPAASNTTTTTSTTPLPTTTTTTTTTSTTGAPTTTTTTTTATTTSSTTTAAPTTTTSTSTPSPTTAAPSQCVASQQDAYCATLNGYGYCKSWTGESSVCQGGNQNCGCTTVSRYLASTTTTTTTAKPAVAEVALFGNRTSECGTGGGGAEAVEVFLWTEIPSGMAAFEDWRRFYRKMLEYIVSNCANARTTRVVLRVLHPRFVPESIQVYWPPQTAPMWTDLLSKLPAGVELVMYPYVETEFEWTRWMEATGALEPLEGVFKFAAMWNEFLSFNNATNRFSAVAIDLEELWVNKLDSVFNATLVNTYKQKYNISDYGVSVGFDATGKVELMASYVDSFYMQWYDFYTDVNGNTYPYVDASAQDSPFLKNLNNPKAMTAYVLERVVTARIQKIYALYASRIYAMWSNQDLNTDCLYILNKSNKCGVNFEFGAWSPEAFNAFIRQLNASSDLFPALKGHGLFQFSFTPLSWMPAAHP